MPQGPTCPSCSASRGEWQHKQVTGEERSSSLMRMKTVFTSTGENGFNKYLLHRSYQSHFPQQRPPFSPTAPSPCWEDVGAESHSSETSAAEEKHLKSPFLLIPFPPPSKSWEPELWSPIDLIAAPQHGVSHGNHRQKHRWRGRWEHTAWIWLPHLGCLLWETPNWAWAPGSGPREPLP